MKDEPFRVSVDNKGRKTYQIDCIIDSHRRTVRPSEPSNLNNTDQAEVGEAQESDAPVSDGGVYRGRWRLISCIKAWPTIDFPLPQMVDYGHDGGAVLQQAIPLISQHSPDLLWNHSADVKDIVGIVENAQWEGASDIPAGINGDLVVDKDFDTRAYVGLSKGTLRSGSIGLTMNMVPSHPDMEMDKFVELQGREVDGIQVRWLPDSIVAVRHMALVPAGTGADRYAGRRASNSKSAVTPRQNRRKGMGTSVEFFQGILSDLGIDVMLTEDTDISASTRDRVAERIKTLNGVRDKYNALASGLQEFGAKIGGDSDPLTPLDVLARLDDLYELAERGKRLVEFKAKEAVGWFDKAKVRPDSGLTDAELRLRARIEASTDLDYLEDIIAEYQGIANERFGDHRTSRVEEPPGPKEHSFVDPDIARSSQKLFG